MYTLAGMLAFLAATGALSAAVIVTVYVILPRLARRAARPRYYRKG